MTEITDKTENLPVAVQQFILHWGDMGNQWGVNRSVAQIHALLYLSENPLRADQIAEVLDIARSNVSNSIKELLSWKLIERVPIAGDRRDHFQAETDLWELVTRIAEGRKAREIDPAKAVLRNCVSQAQGDARVSPTALKRLKAMLDFVETVDRWYAQMLRLPKSTIMTLMKMGGKISGLLGRGGLRDADADPSDPERGSGQN
jgi:DNA-binding transcriptional regulator GbsR (MarR family)